jgi:hypothetical protein
MDTESNDARPENPDVFQELENLRRPELDPRSPIFRINGIIKTIESFQESEIYDPAALSKQCLDLYAEAAKEAQKHIGYCGVSSAMRLNILYQENLVPVAELERVKNQLMTIKLPNDIVDRQVWYVSPRSAQGAIRTVVAVVAFVCSFFEERFIRKHLDLHESEWVVADLLTSLGVFGISYVLFDWATDGIKDKINWMVFRRTQRNALKNLRGLKECCEQYFAKFDALIPVPVKVI